ncbi:MAG TPA: C4-dicarboxylate ABC transporter, partial [Rhodocyclaceae bacterium]|nr:C4-dicarboxylate ABC transporter [Rhodocyclaceae bacterium]
MTNRLRKYVLPVLASVALLGFSAASHAQAPKVLKLSHQFPASNGDDGDFRDRLARKFAAEVEKKTGGSLKIEIYPGSSLMKT